MAYGILPLTLSMLICLMPLLRGFELDLTSNVTAVFLTCCNRHMMLRQTLYHFKENNDYPIRQVIVVNDGQMTPFFFVELRAFQNLTILATGGKVGQLMAVDMAYRLVKTPTSTTVRMIGGSSERDLSR